MSYELFEKERRVIDSAKAILSAGEITDPEAKIAFSELLKQYQRLFKSTQRLVRVSDRNEEQLNQTAKSLDEKTKMLESLSTKLAKYLSPQVYDSIFLGKQDAELRTSRKKLTVFFSDIKDFTEITEDLQPEDLTFLLNSYFKEMSWIAMEHSATIDKFIGDAMLIFFGDPESFGMQEDAMACVGMAIAMQRRMKELEKEWAALGFSRPLRMRIGINTGYCNVGNFGSDSRMDYTIIGGEVNLTARLESLADPGGILISHETRLLVDDLIEAEERGEVTCKGIRKPVRAYSVLNILDDDEPSEAAIKTRLDGLSLTFDPEKLPASAREEALAALRAATKAIENVDGALEEEAKSPRKSKGRKSRPSSDPTAA